MKKNLITFSVLFTYSLSSFAIRNGIEIKLEDRKFPNIVMIESIGTCTGQRISYDKIITASHCIEKTHSRDKSFTVTYLDGEKIRSEKIPYSKAKKKSKDLSMELIVFPINPESSEDMFKPNKVIDLTSGTEIIPSSLIIAGYGVTAEGNNTNKILRFGRSYFDNIKNSDEKNFLIGLNANPVQKQEQHKPCLRDFNTDKKDEIDLLESQFNEIEFEGKKDQVVCRGDSGGPAYARTTSGELIFLGIQSHAVYTGDLNVRNASDKDLCEAFSKSYVIPVSIHQKYLEKNGISIELYNN